MNQKEKKVVGYGINISHKNESFERVSTFNDENVAKAFYHSLLVSDEIKSGAKIDLEKIYEVKDGYEYEVMLKNYKRVFKVPIEEHISQIFEVEADTFEEAIEIAKQKYYDGEFVLDQGNLTYKCMTAYEGNGDYTEWIEF